MGDENAARRAELRRITEVGLAVRDLEAARALLVDLFGAEGGPIVEVPAFAMRMCMCRLGKVDLELMAPTGTTGVIADYLAHRGEGIHHIAFAVDDLGDAVDALTAHGVEIVPTEARSLDSDLVARAALRDFAGRPVDGEIRFAFTHPRSILGTLIELIEYPAGYQTP